MAFSVFAVALSLHVAFGNATLLHLTYIVSDNSAW
jgi:hypothetical protein